MRTQMVPVATITDQLHRAVRDLARALGKDVRWEVEGERDRARPQRAAAARGLAAAHRPQRRRPRHRDPEERVPLASPPTAPSASMRSARLRGDHLGVRRRARHRRRRACGPKAARHGLDTDGLTDDEALQLMFRSGVDGPLLTEISGAASASTSSRPASRRRAAASRSSPRPVSAPCCGSSCRSRWRCCRACWSRPAANASRCRCTASSSCTTADVATSHGEGRRRPVGRR